MSHKDKMKIVKKEVKSRRSWGTLNPVTRIVQSEKKYKRGKEKKNVRREIFECMG